MTLVIVVVVLKKLFHDNVKVGNRPWPCEHGGRLNGVSAARQHLGIPARRSDRASFQRTALYWSTAESRAGAAAVWRRNPAGEVSILSDAALLEKKRNRCYLVLVSRETGFPGEFVEGQGKSSLKGEGLTTS